MESSINQRKHSYKAVIFAIKAIPFFSAIMIATTLILGYFGLPTIAVGTICGLSVLTAAFAYTVSIALGIDWFYRLPVHFIVIFEAIAVFQVLLRLPISEKAWMNIYLSLAILFITLSLVIGCRKWILSKRAEQENVARIDPARRKRIYRNALLTIKSIPFLLALCYIIHLVLQIRGIVFPYMTLLASASILMYVFIYLCSAVFGFCRYHRMPIHFCLLTETLVVLQTKYGIIPSANATVWMYYIAIALFVLLTLFFWYRERAKRKQALNDNPPIQQ